MYVNLQFLFYQVVLSAFRQTVLQVRSILARKMASFLCQDPCTFAMTISLKRRITRRFKRQFSDGCFIWMKPNLKIVLKKKQRSTITNTSLILLHWLIDFGHVFKNQMTCQKTLQHCLIMTCISLTQILFQNLLNCIIHSA